MKPLKTCQRVLMWFCVCPTNEAITKSEKMAHKILTFFLVASIMSIFVSCSIYFWKFVLIDLEEALNAVYQNAGLFSALYMFVVVYLSRPQINAIFDDLSEIYRKSEFFSVLMQNRAVFMDEIS